MNKRRLIKIIMEARKSLPQINTMPHKDFGELLKPGHVSLSRVTEKTDGSAILMGHDQQGFYTQSSGSGKEKMRSKLDYIKRAARRSRETGKPLNLRAAKAFGKTHEKLAANSKLVGYLKKKSESHPEGDTKLKGELFDRPSAKDAESHPNPNERHPRHVYFVATSYHRKHLGSHGAIVLHTGLEDNKDHDPNHVTKLGDQHISFHHDIIDVPKSKVDVSKERQQYSQLNHDLLGSRTTKKNKEAKTTETERLSSIRQAVHNKINKHVEKLGISKSKWGQGTPEGHVVHPSQDAPTQPRFKLISKAFANRDKDSIKRRLKNND